MKTAAIIQARMKSTRLPGKVLMPLAGKPLLLHILERLRRARLIDEIAITTSTEAEDDKIAEFARAQDICVTRGDEANVLARFAAAAEVLKPDAILRVTGDSPLIDPWFVDLLMTRMQDTGADFLMLEDGVKCIQEGVDAFSRRALDVLLTQGRGDPVAMEHVTGWLKVHPDAVRTERIQIPPDYQFSARLSVDTPADLQFLEKLSERLDLSRVSLCEVAALLKREPWLMTLNAHIHQKSATQITANVLLRADGGGMLGLGHVMRTAALAEALRDRAGLGVIALTGAHPQGDAEAARFFFEARKIPVVVKPAGKTEEIFIADEAKRLRARAIVLDVRTALPRVAVEHLRAQGLAVIAIDDASERRLAADLCVYPPVPQVSELDWTGAKGERAAGANMVLVSPEIARAAQELAPIAKAPRLLVSMGGSDPARATGPIAAACTRVLGDELAVDVVIGPHVQDADELEAWMAKLPGIVVHRSPKDIAALYRQASLAIISFGVTAYELAALGVPALYVALTEDHRRSAAGAEALGFGKFVAMAKDLSAPKLAREAAHLLSTQSELQKMSAAGRKAIDGQGAQRIAARIAELIASQARETKPSRSTGTSPAKRRPAAAG